MRVVMLFLTIILLSSCSDDNSKEQEEDIFIATQSKNLSGDGKYFLTDFEKPLRFSKGFWNYFIKVHPKVSGIIFFNWTIQQDTGWLNIPDTSLTFFKPTFLDSSKFAELLPSDAIKTEKGDSIIHAGFIVTNYDSVAEAQKEMRIQKKLKDYKITPTVIDDYNRLRNILTLKDTSKHYIIVFKKSYLKKIYDIYN